MIRARGPLLVWINVVVSAACIAIQYARFGFTGHWLHECIHLLTPIGFLYFIAAFIARPLRDLVGGAIPRWMVANRRYLGLSFAVWHLWHWPILTTLLVMIGPAEFWEQFASFVIPATGVLIVITVLAATSSNGAQRALGRRVWSAIHTVGVYLIWGWFLRVYWRKLPSKSVELHDYVAIGILVAALGIRMIAAARRMAKPPPAA